MRPRQQRVANRARLITFRDQIAEGGEVLEALRHLLAHRVLKVLRVHPVTDERLFGCGLALCDLVLVVGKDVVDAAGMDVEALAQVLHAHGGALDVPAGAPNAERRLPRLLTRLARLPQHEVARLVLAIVVDIDAGAGLQSRVVKVSELAVPWKGGDSEIGRAVRDIGVAFLAEQVDQRDHFEDVFRGSRVVLSTFDAQRIEVIEKRLDVFLGELVDRLAVLGRLLDDAVLDIGQIHHLRDAVPLLQQDSSQQVLEEEGPEVPDVGIVVDRWAAGVHPNMTRFDRLELLDPTIHRVVEAHRHHLTSRSSTTAWAASASPLPIGPTWSVVVAFSPTAPGSMPSTPARLFRMASR